MKTISTVLLLLSGFITSVTLAQTPRTALSGRVFDAKTHQPVPFATVFLNNTSQGTTADENGAYRLPNVPLGSQELVGSSVGYQTTRQPVRLTDTRSRTVDLNLTPADNALATVTVTGRHNSAWVRQFRTFSRELLGNRPQARQCQIMNGNGLSFSEEKGHLLAQAAEPLVIENRGLGYRLTYNLLRFDLYRGQMQFAGTSRFEELKSTDARQQAQWQANRLKAYRGSLRHLLVSLLAGTQEQEGYTVYRTPLALNPGTIALPLVRTADRQPIGPAQATALFKPGELAFERRLISNQPLEVYYNRIYESNSPYRDSPYAYSMLLLPNQTVDLTTDGWITQGHGLDVRGYLGNDRLATLLPIDWVPTDNETMTAGDITAGRPLRSDAGLDSIGAAHKRAYARQSPVVFVHTDKGLYATGDYLWFSAYALDPARHLPVVGQTGPPLQVDITAPDGHRVQHQWLHLADGRAAGSFRLGDTLAAGTYQLRAYSATDSVTTEPAYARSLLVYNLQQPVLTPLTSQTATGLSSHAVGRASRPDSLDLQFLAESGHWLAGVPGKLGIKVLQANGHGRAVTGRIVDQAGTAVAQFTTSALGIGHVLLTPLAGQRYAALIDQPAKAAFRPIVLPPAEPEGWALAADAYSDSTRLVVTIRATGRYQNESVYITLQDRNQLVYQQKWQVHKGEAQFTLPTTLLQPGVCRLTLWDDTGRARAERLVFTPERTPPVNMRVILGKTHYAPRETVAISFQLRDADAYPVAALWSASVTDADQLPVDTARSDMRTHLLLTGGLRGTIESPLSYLEAGQLGALDDLLLTQGWRRLPTRQPADSIGGWAISGRVRDKRGQPLSGSPVLLTLEQAGQQMQRTLLTDAQGRFLLDGLLIEDTVQVRARAMTPGQSGAVVRLDTPGLPITVLAPVAPDWQSLTTSLTEARARQLAFPAFYRDTTARHLKEVIVRASKPVAERPLDVQRASIHGEADGVLTVNKTLASSFTTMGQLLRLVPGVQLVNGAIRIRSYSSLGDLPPPLYLIDGVYADESSVNQLIPHEVVRIELLKNANASIYGVRGANGVIAIYTRKGEDAAPRTKSTAVTATVIGFATPREFYLPRYDLPGLSPGADKRDVLYWNALGQSGTDGLATLNFPLSDTARRIRLVIEGLTTEGIPISFSWILPVR